MGIPPATALVALGLFDAATHYFEESLQGGVAAEVGAH